MAGSGLIIIILGIVLPLLLLAGLGAGIFFAVRALIRYNARVKREAAEHQEELDKMNIQDL